MPPRYDFFRTGTTSPHCELGNPRFEHCRHSSCGKRRGKRTTNRRPLRTLHQILKHLRCGKPPAPKGAGGFSCPHFEIRLALTYERDAGKNVRGATSAPCCYVCRSLLCTCNSRSIS